MEPRVVVGDDAALAAESVGDYVAESRAGFLFEAEGVLYLVDDNAAFESVVYVVRYLKKLEIVLVNEDVVAELLRKVLNADKFHLDPVLPGNPLEGVFEMGDFSEELEAAYTDSVGTEVT